MTTKVYHAKQAIFRDSLFYEKDATIYNQERALREFRENDNYELVAEFRDAPTSVERAYTLTQNLDKPWCLPPKRSTSVGDIIAVDGELWVVATLGMDKLVVLLERQSRELFKDKHWTARNIGYEVDADPAIVEKILQAPITPDEDPQGRSCWKWIRLATGGLVLACYPKGDTYFDTEADPERP